MFSVPQSDELALSKEFPPIHFTSVQDLKKRGAALREEVENGGQCQHIAFRQIIEDQFERLQKSRADLGRGITFTWFEDIKTLIIKIPAMPHEKAHLGFERIMTRKAVAIGLDDLEFSSIGSTLYKGQRSAKEADSSWMNQIVRPQKEQFPHFVIEAGLSESLPRPRADAKWWVEHSKGEVNIVLIIWIRPERKMVRIEKWCPGQTPPTRSSSRLARSNAFPTMVAEVAIDQLRTPSVISGAPLCLEFHKVIGRPAVPPLEQDFVFSVQDLDKFVTNIWVGT